MNISLNMNTDDEFHTLTPPRLAGSANDEVGLTSDIVAEIVFRVLIYFVGVVGNLLVIFVIVFLSEYKKITHWYVLQLALADILFLQTLPFHIAELVWRKPFDSVDVCRARQTIFFLTYFASILFLMVMAVDRYLAVCHSLSTKIQRIRSHSNSVIITAVVWLISIGFSIPVFMYSNMVGIRPSCSCVVHFPSSADDQEWVFNQNQCKDSLFDPITNNPVEGFAELGSSEISLDSYDLPDLDPSLLAGHGMNGSAESRSSEISGGTEISLGSHDLPDLDPSLLAGHGMNGSDLGYPDIPTFDDHIVDGCIYKIDRIGWHIFLYLNMSLMFLVPMAVISVCYGMIVRKLARTNISGTREKKSSSTKKSAWGAFLRRGKKGPPSKASTGKSYKEKRRVIVMCAALVLLFLCCWMPIHAVHIAKLVGIPSRDKSFCNTLTSITSILAFLNSALNPYLYNFLGTFKKRMRQIRSHSRMQALLSATGLTRVGGRSSRSSRSGSAGNSSEGTKGKKSSIPNEGSSVAQSERIQLQPLGIKQNE